jgi:hypothetical protein
MDGSVADNTSQVLNASGGTFASFENNFEITKKWD